MKKAVSLFLAVVFVLLVFAGCSDDKLPDSTPTGTPAATTTPSPDKTAPPDNTEEPDSLINLPLSEETTEFTVWAQAPWPFLGIGDYNETESFIELERRTNVHINWMSPSRTDTTASFNLTIASNDLPDSFMVYSSLITAGFDSFIEDEFITEVTDLVYENCPNYVLQITQPDIEKGVLTDTGKLPGFFGIKRTFQPTWFGPQTRGDWVDEQGIAPPATFDELHDMLVIYRDVYNCEMPTTIGSTTMPQDYLNAWGISNSFYQVDGKVMYGPLQDEYLECLTLLNSWWNEDLIDKDFYVAASTPRHMDTTLTLTGRLGHWSSGYMEIQNNMMLAESAGDTVYYLQPLSMPVLNKGDTRCIGNLIPDRFQGNIGTISPSCENPVILAKWYDYLFSEEGWILSSYGTGTAFYYDENGNPKCNELIYDNPDDLASFFAMCLYSMSPDIPTLYDWERELLPTLSPIALEAPSIWDANYTDTRTIPRMLAITADESSKYAAVMSDVETYLSEMYVKFVIGTEPLSKFEEFRQNIINLGIQDAIDIKQAALERYNQR